MSVTSVLRSIPRKCCLGNKKRNRYVTDMFSVTPAPISKQEQQVTENRPCYGDDTTEGGLDPPPCRVRNTLLSLWDELLRRTRVARHSLMCAVAARAPAHPENDLSKADQAVASREGATAPRAPA
jgi:hypothetical protein